MIAHQGGVEKQRGEAGGHNHPCVLVDELRGVDLREALKRNHHGNRRDPNQIPHEARPAKQRRFIRWSIIHCPRGNGLHDGPKNERTNHGREEPIGAAHNPSRCEWSPD